MKRSWIMPLAAACGVVTGAWTLLVLFAHQGPTGVVHGLTLLMSGATIATWRCWRTAVVQNPPPVPGTAWSAATAWKKAKDDLTDHARSCVCSGTPDECCQLGLELAERERAAYAAAVKFLPAIPRA